MRYEISGKEIGFGLLPSHQAEVDGACMVRDFYPLCGERLGNGV